MFERPPTDWGLILSLNESMSLPFPTTCLGVRIQHHDHGQVRDQGRGRAREVLHHYLYQPDVYDAHQHGGGRVIAMCAPTGTPMRSACTYACSRR